MFLSNPVLAQNSLFTVVLDAGHGGKDPGTVGLKTFKKSYESDIALKVVNKIGVLLKKDNDIKTVYTRKTNKFIELHRRGKIANNANADLFISVHCNSASTTAYGTTTYVLGMGRTDKNLELSKRENDVILLEDDREKNYKYNPNSQEFLIGLTLMQEDYLERSIEFASIVQNKFKTVAKRKNRGVNQGNLAVLYDTYMPSVLIEIGFLTNKSEEKYLHTKNGQAKIAASIYQAIKTYKKRLEKNSVKTVNVKNKQVDVSSKPVIGNSKYYRIQIATSKRKIEAKSYNFNGLKSISRIKVGNIYKYFYGIANNINDAKILRKEAVLKGYKDAFVKRFKFDKSKGDVHQLNYIDSSKKKVAVNSSVVPSNVIKKGVIFKVQLASSPKKINTVSYNFKGLQNVERIKTGSYYKYYYGSTSNYELIKKMNKTAKNKGYSDCFIVAIENGERVSIREVLKR